MRCPNFKIHKDKLLPFDNKCREYGSCVKFGSSLFVKADVCSILRKDAALLDIFDNFAYRMKFADVTENVPAADP